MASNCAVLHPHHVEALLCFLLLCQQQRHLQGMFFLQTPLHVFQSLDSPLRLLYVQRDKNEIDDLCISHLTSLLWWNPSIFCQALLGLRGYSFLTHTEGQFSVSVEHLCYKSCSFRGNSHLILYPIQPSVSDDGFRGETTLKYTNHGWKTHLSECPAAE